MKKFAVVFVMATMSLAAMACDRAVGSDCSDGFSAKSFLLVNRVDGNSGTQPQFSLQAVGEEVHVTAIFFTARADAPYEVDPPEGCTSLYENDPSERVLTISCPDGITVPADGETIVSMTLSGPWSEVRLYALHAEDAEGNPVYNDLSSDQAMLFNNPDPPTN